MTGLVPHNRVGYQHVRLQPSYTVGYATADSFMMKIPGIPAPQGSKTPLGKTKNGKHKMKESSDYVKPWRDVMSTSIHAATSGFKPYPVVRLACVFLMPRPGNHFSAKTGDVKESFLDAWCTTRIGDLDKLIRAVSDALTTAEAITDDAAIVEYGRMKKIYTKSIHSGPTWSTPGVVLEVTNLADCAEPREPALK